MIKQVLFLSNYVLTTPQMKSLGSSKDSPSARKGIVATLYNHV